VVVLACIVFIGNIAMGLNETYIFPGAYIYGSDTRTLTQEVLETAQWFRETKGVNVSIVSDRYNGLALSSIGMENTSRASAGFPVYQLYFSSEQPSNYLMGELQYSSFEYMLTDKNMTRYLPKIGVYFEPDEPLANQRTVPPPLAAITRFNSFPWTIKIYQSDNLAIYRYNFDALGLKWQKQKAK